MPKLFMKALLTTAALAVLVAPLLASADTISVVSDSSVKIIGVYNKAGGPANFVDLSSSPLNAVRAQEPKPYPTGYVSEGAEVTDSVWDTGTGLYFQNTNPGADWIWETERAEGPAEYATTSLLYDADASKNGRVVVFEKEFTLGGTPAGGLLHIAADNTYEVWINGAFLTRSGTAGGAGWEVTDLTEANVSTVGWETVGHVAIPAGLLLNGTNTIKILAGNEYYWSDDGNFPAPLHNLSPYYQYNPGALIFKADLEYEPVIDPGCTLTQGYWKTHSTFGPSPYDATWALLGEGTSFFLSNKTYYEVFWTPVAGNPYYQLAHQYIAAVLNKLSGANSTPAVEAALTAAEAIFNTYSPATSWTKAQRSALKTNAATLADYNEGLIGPGHCGQ